MRFIFVSFFFFSFSFLTTSFGQTLEPSDIQKNIPGGKLRLDYVLKRAIASSKTYRAIDAEKYSSLASEAAAKQPYDWFVYGEAKKYKNSFESLSAASPRSTEISSYHLGLRTYLPTGTSANLQIGNSLQDLVFSSSLFQVPKSNEAKLSFTVSQKLLADSFGTATRAGVRAQQLAAQGKLQSHQSLREDWSLQLIQQFYSAWLAQRLVQISQENLQRRESLVANTKQKLNRGTAERPDLLQAEAAYLLSKDAVAGAKANLQAQWRNLLRFLDLPMEWESYPAEKIPLELDSPEQNAADICKIEQEYVNPRLRQVELEKRAAEEAIFAATSRARPDLNLFGSLEWNGIEGGAAAARKEVLRRDHPAWAVGLAVEIPLGNFQRKSEVEMARAQLLAAEGRLESEQDARYLRFRKICDDWRRERDALADAEGAFLKQKQRLNLEEKRFQLGRVNLFQLIQAGDDLSAVETTKTQLAAQLRLTSWNIIRESPKLGNFLREWEEDYGENN
jgi:outer membrane protein TolC